VTPVVRGPAACLVTLALVMFVAGCGTSDPEAESDNEVSPGPTSSATPSAASTPSTQGAGAADPSAFPLPPGAAGWPVKDLKSCADLGRVTDRKLVVRVAVATRECESYGADALVIAAEELPYDNTSDSRPVDIAGYDGKVTAVGVHQNLGQRMLVEPASGDVKYLILSSGGAGITIEDLTRELLKAE